MAFRLFQPITTLQLPLVLRLGIIVALLWVATVETVNTWLPLAFPWHRYVQPKLEAVLSEEAGLDASTPGGQLQLSYLHGLVLRLNTVVARPSEALPFDGERLTHPWRLHVNTLTIHFDPLAFFFQGGEGSIKALRLDQPVLWLNGQTGYRAFVQYLKWLPLRHKKPQARQVQWFKRSRLEASEFVVVSPGWPLVMKGTPFPVRLTGQSLRVDFQQGVRAVAQGDLEAQVRGVLSSQGQSPNRQQQRLQFADALGHAIPWQPLVKANLSPVKFTLADLSTWNDGLDWGQDPFLTVFSGSFIRLEQLNLPLLKAALQEINPAYAQGFPRLLHREASPSREQGRQPSLALTISKPLFGDTRHPLEVVLEAELPEPLPLRFQQPHGRVVWPASHVRLAGRMDAAARDLTELALQIKAGEGSLTAEGDLWQLPAVLTKGRMPHGRLMVNAEGWQLGQWQPVLAAMAAKTWPPSQQPVVQGQVLAQRLQLAAQPGQSWQMRGGQLLLTQGQVWTTPTAYRAQKRPALRQLHARLAVQSPAAGQPDNPWVLTLRGVAGEQGQLLAKTRGVGFQETSPVEGALTLNALKADTLQRLVLPFVSVPQVKRLGQEVAATGTLSAKLQWHGTLGQPQPKGQLAINNLQLYHPSSKAYLLGLDGTLWLSGSQSPRLFTRKPLRVQLTPQGDALALSASLPLLPQQQPSSAARVHLVGEALDLARLRRGLENWQHLLALPALQLDRIPPIAGRGRLALQLTSPNLQQWRAAGTVQLTQLATEVPGERGAKTRVKQGQVTLRLTEANRVELADGQAVVEGLGPVTLEGWLDLQQQQYQLQMQANRIALAETWAQLRQQLPNAAQLPVTHLEGFGRVNLALSGKVGQHLVLHQALAQTDRVLIHVRDLPEPVVINQLHLTQEGSGQRLVFRNSGGHVGPVGFTVDGWLALDDLLAGRSKQPAYELVASVPQLPVQTLRENRAFWQPFLPPGWDREVFNTAGYLSAKAKIVPGNWQGQLQFHNAGLYIARTLAPYHGITGIVTANPQGIQLAEPLHVNIGNGFVNVRQLQVATNRRPWSVTVLGNARLSELELNNLIGNPLYYQPTQYPIELDGELRLNGQWDPYDWLAANNQLLAHTGMVLKVREQPASALTAPQPANPTEDGAEASQPTSPQTTAVPRLPTQANPGEQPRTTSEEDPGQQKPVPLLVETRQEPSPVDEPPATALVATAAMPSQPTEAERVSPVTVEQLLASVKDGYQALFTWIGQLALTPRALTLQPASLRLLGYSEPLRMMASIPLLEDLPPADEAALNRSLAEPGNTEKVVENEEAVDDLGEFEAVDVPDSTAPTPWRKPSLQGRIWLDTPLQLADLSPYVWNPVYRFDSGTLALDTRFQFYSFTPQQELEAQGDGTPPPLSLEGQLVVDNVVAPNLLLDKLAGTLTFSGNQMRVDITEFQSMSTEATYRAIAPSINQYPVVLQGGELTGPLFYTEGFQQFLARLTRQALAPISHSQPVSRQWLNAYTTRLPIEIHQTRVAIDEAILDNIIMQQVTGTINLYANGFLEFDNMDLSVAGGKASGTLSINPSVNNTLSLTLDSESVRANALAQILLDAPNEIFGDLSGRIQFTTTGDTQEQLLQNANGMASFQIREGRLPSIAKVETLLTAANVVRGGILGLNLNNLVRTLKPFETNYFAFLYGDFQVAQGVIYTDNLVSDGENLDLLIKGGIRLDNGHGNLVVVGNMSQDVSGQLGRLGQLSLSGLIRHIPILGFFPGGSSDERRRGLVYYLPGVGFIPGVGGTAEAVNTFKVRMIGPLDDPGSVQDLNWLN